MVIYTPVPVEALTQSPEEERRFTEIPFGDAVILAEVTPEGNCKVVRLISSNPDDFLNPDFQPGSEIMMAPVFQSLYFLGSGLG